MNTVEKRIRALLQGATMMQLATVHGAQPWCCTVYFVADDDLNLYWISTPERRHSREIEMHAKVAAAIPIKYVPGKDVVGIQAEGDATLVNDEDEMKKAIDV